MWTNKSLSELTTFCKGSFVNWAAEFKLGTDSKPVRYTDDEANIMLAAMQFEVEDFTSIRRTRDEVEIDYADGSFKKYVSLDIAAKLSGVTSGAWKQRISTNGYDCIFLKKFYVLESDVLSVVEKKRDVLEGGYDPDENYITLKEAHAISGLKPATWWQRIKTGVVEGQQVDGHWYVKRGDAYEAKNVQDGFGYTELARKVGKSNVTIRNLEKRGVISASVSACGEKYFTDADARLVLQHYAGGQKAKLVDESSVDRKRKSRKQSGGLPKKSSSELALEDRVTVKPIVRDHTYSYVSDLFAAVKSGVSSEYDDRFLQDIERISKLHSYRGDDEVWMHAQRALSLEYSMIERLFERRSQIRGRDRDSLEMFLLLLERYIVGSD